MERKYILKLYLILFFSSIIIAPSTSCDSDGDGVIKDNCPDISNPMQLDSDGDGIGDMCDILQSCKAIYDTYKLETGKEPVDGTYTIDPDGDEGKIAPFEVYCEMPEGYTFFVGNIVQNDYNSISSGCINGLSPFQVKSISHSNALEKFVGIVSSNGSFYYANVFAGPDNSCTQLDTEIGYLKDAKTWVDIKIDEITLAPLNITQNCNQNLFDPIPLKDLVGYSNRGGSTYLYNSSEVIEKGKVICSLNDI